MPSVNKTSNTSSSTTMAPKHSPTKNTQKKQDNQEKIDNDVSDTENSPDLTEEIPTKTEKTTKKKKMIHKPGSKTQSNIKKQQASKKPAMLRRPFGRLVRYVMSNRRPKFGFSEGVLDRLQDNIESFVIQILEQAKAVSVFDKRPTTLARDLMLVLKLDKSLPYIIRQTMIGGYSEDGTTKDDLLELPANV